MDEDTIIDWERVIHKNVRTSDGLGAGNIVAIDGDNLIIESAGDQVHAVYPKSLVGGFNGAEVILNKPYAELGRYIKS